MALILYAPVVFMLVYHHLFAHAFIAGLVIVGLTRIPDWDIWMPFVEHRGITHTFLFAAGMGIVSGVGLAGMVYMASDVITYYFEYQATIWTVLINGAFGFAIGVLSVIAHLLADVITPAGIQPLQPFSDTRVRYPMAKASNPVANAVLFSMGVWLTLGAIVMGIYLGEVPIVETLRGLVQEPSLYWEI